MLSRRERSRPPVALFLLDPQGMCASHTGDVQQAYPSGAHVCAPEQISHHKGVLFCVILPPEG
jgi:hypothetical protein